MDTYTAPQISELLEFDAQTIRRWAQELRDYLSPTANPPANGTRIFTEDDLPVLALAATMRRENPKVSYADIRAVLANGERGIVPDLTALAVVSDNKQHALALIDQIQGLQHDITRLEAQLEMSEKRARDAETERDKLLKEKAVLEYRLQILEPGKSGDD